MALLDSDARLLTPTARSPSVGRNERIAFWICVVAAGALMWLAPRLPMTDLPQHAGQIALWRDLLTGSSPWSRLVFINLLTPYLIGYGSALPLSFFLSIEASIAVVLTLAFYAFVASCVALRKELGGDDRLDWLFLPSYFGFAWQWGFYTYLTAAPVFILFLLLALRYRRRTDARRGAFVVAAGVGLLFAHGLLFLFGLFLAAVLLLGRRGEAFRVRVARLAPVIVLTLTLALFALVTHERGTSAHFGSIRFGEPIWVRLFGALAFISGTNWNPDPILSTLAAIALATPIFIGCRANRGAPQVFFAALALVFLLLPAYALQTGYLFHRFALFLPIFFAFLFRRGTTKPGAEGGERAARVVMALCCVATLCVQGWRIWAFGRESESFVKVEQAAEPGHRALGIVFDGNSPAAHAKIVYDYFPAWYQADRGGFTDFNFAWFPPQVVRFRPAQTPAIGQAFAAKFADFDWQKDQGWLYDYFFLRGPLDRVDWLKARSPCALSLVAISGPWILVRRDSCPSPAPVAPAG